MILSLVLDYVNLLNCLSDSAANKRLSECAIEKQEQLRPLGHVSEVRPGAKIEGSSVRAQKKKEHKIEGQIELQNQPCLKCVESQGRVERLVKGFVAIVASVENLKEVVQDSNQTDQSLAERIANLENSVHSLKKAAQNGKQDDAKLIKLDQQVCKNKKALDESDSSLLCQLQDQNVQMAEMKSLIEQQSLKSQENEDQLKSLSVQLVAQTKRANEIEEWKATVQQKDFSQRLKQLEHNCLGFRNCKEIFEAAERCGTTSGSIFALMERMHKVETNSINMYQYDLLLKRLMLLETMGASKKEVSDLCGVLFQFSKAAATTNQIEALIQRNDSIAERVRLVESAQPSARLIEQTKEQNEVIQDLARKMEQFEKTEAQIRSETPDPSEILDLTLRTANILSVHHDDITSLQEQSKLSCAILQELKGRVKRTEKGVSCPSIEIIYANVERFG